MPAEALGHQRVAVKMRFVVAVSMNAGDLCEDVLTDDRRIGRIANATVSCNNVTDLHQCRLIDMFLDMHLVFQHHMDTAQRRIATTLS